MGHWPSNIYSSTIHSSQDTETNQFVYEMMNPGTHRRFTQWNSTHSEKKNGIKLFISIYVDPLRN